MNDRELLEQAAKAAGLTIDKSPCNGGTGNDGFDILGNVVLDWHNGTKWNPLTDDGDALRLAVKLEISFIYSEFVGAAEARWGRANFRLAEYNPVDPCAATRRAIVRAAAEIGRALE